MISAHLNSLNSRERHRELIAQAEQQRLARQLRDLARASQRSGRTRGQPGPRRAGLGAAVLMRLLPRYRSAR